MRNHEERQRLREASNEKGCREGRVKPYRESVSQGGKLTTSKTIFWFNVTVPSKNSSLCFCKLMKISPDTFKHQEKTDPTTHLVQTRYFYTWAHKFAKCTTWIRIIRTAHVCWYFWFTLSSKPQKLCFDRGLKKKSNTETFP